MSDYYLINRLPSASAAPCFAGRPTALALFLLLASCGGYTTPGGIEYNNIDQANLDLDKIPPNQLDRAWQASKELWATQHTPPNVYFWDRPIPWGAGGDAGAYDGRVHIYLREGHEACLFRQGNEGALVHEFGHVLGGSAEHTEPQWQQVGPLRAQLLTLCP